MAITLSDLQARHSVRSYKDVSLPEDAVRKIKAEIQFINSHESGLHFQLIENDREPFAGFRRSYGAFRNAQNYLAAAIESEYDNAYERAGYYAEQIAILAVSLGLATCFVGGTFSRQHSSAQIRASWSLPFILLIGMPDGGKESLMARITHSFIHRNDSDWKSFYQSENLSLESALKLNKDLESALKAVACAPSSLNKRPVRICLDHTTNNIVAFTNKNDSKTMIDLGIAKYNICSITGLWPEWGNHAPLVP